MHNEKTVFKRLVNRRDFLKNVSVGTAALGITRWGTRGGLAGQESKRPAEPLYNEKYRPQFHFTPKKNWTNDPNGLVYYKGEYHLFFQHNPLSIKWGNMTWGHALSTDLMHWKQLPHAIEPDELGTIFSGSAVVDWKNTSGFQTGKENVLVAFYTSAGEFAEPKKPFTQSIAYSNDRGRTWVKYKGNPIIGNMKDDANRDPKVIWHEPTKQWIMALFLDAGDEFALLSSKDLKQWEVIQELLLPGSRECPDFFELPVDGDATNTRWVFWGANGRYLLGGFDGKEFTPETDVLESTVGNHYAAQTYSDIPKSDGRRIQIAWMAKGKFPDMPFNQQMSIPCELTLRTLPEGIRLCMQPVREIKNIRGPLDSWRSLILKPGENPLAKIAGELFEIECEIDPAGAAEVGFGLRGNELTYNVEQKTLHCRGKKIDVTPVKGNIRLHILVDRTSIEVFSNESPMSMFLCFPLDPDSRTLEVFARGGQAKVEKLNVWKLKSIWTG
ncbi:MAG: glycoside hydrolase family 32 protein [Planctomycetota bacterium]|jgi:sucrose-6-phosphate hydrolase SacC (GH32 family)